MSDKHCSSFVVSATWKTSPGELREKTKEKLDRLAQKHALDGLERGKTEGTALHVFPGKNPNQVPTYELTWFITSAQDVEADLSDCMDMMQDDPEFEEADTLAAMEESISFALYAFSGDRRDTRDKQERTWREDCIAAIKALPVIVPIDEVDVESYMVDLKWRSLSPEEAAQEIMAQYYEKKGVTLRTAE